MSRYAVVQESDGLVANVILLNIEDEWPVPEGCFIVLLGDNQPCGPGWYYIDGEFTDPQEVV